MPIYNGLASGGSESKTLLWQNESPTSAFASQTITLSDDANKFKRLRIDVYLSTTSTYSVYFDLSDPSLFLSGSARCALSQYSSSYGYVRYGSFSETYNKIWWSAAYRVGTTNSSTSVAKPLYIYGVK